MIHVIYPAATGRILLRSETDSDEDLEAFRKKGD
jgi:hypothetical protein